MTFEMNSLTSKVFRAQTFFLCDLLLNHGRTLKLSNSLLDKYPGGIT
jgi:hypothetical protein